MGEREPAEHPPRPLPWAGILAGVAVAFGLGYGLAWWLMGAETLKRAVAIGDALGPLAALFSAIGLIGAIVSVEYQRKELADNRVQLQRTADAQEAQVKALEAAARLAEAQRVLLARSAHSARLQASATAWQWIHQFIWESQDALAVVRKYLEVARQQGHKGASYGSLMSLRPPAAPLFLDCEGQELGESVVDQLTAARKSLVLIFEEKQTLPIADERFKSAVFHYHQAELRILEYKSRVAEVLRDGTDLE